MAKTILELLYGSSQNNEQKTQEAKQNAENPNFFIRGLHTIGDIAANVLTGAAKGLEGIYDFGAGIVGAVGGIFNEDFQDDVQNHIAYDWTSENIGNPLQELTKYSYTNEWGAVGELIEGAASGVGQLLPAVGASLIPGVGAVAANAALFASATGSATESAYNDGASYYGGLGYGLASGAVELATERLTGGATKNVFGRGMIDGVGKSIADTGLKRVAKNALSEGFEEALAEVANPALKAIYKGKNAFSEYTSPEFIGNVGKAAAIGSLTALGYSGTVGYGMSRIKTKNGKRLNYVGAEADVNDSLQEIEGQKAKRNNLFTYDKLSVENEAKIVENVKANYQNIEKALKKATPEKREKLIKEFRLEKAFEADGTMNADFASTLDYTKQAEVLTENGVQGEGNAVASLDRRYINPDLIGQEKKIRETFATVTEDLRQNYMQAHNATYEQAVEAVKEITPFQKDFTDKGKASYSKFKKGLNYLNRISGHTVNMVVVDEHDIFNGHILGDTIYIGADTFENDTWAGTLVHEYTHFAEDSKEYKKLIRYLREDASLFEKAFESVSKKGYVSQREMEWIFDKVQRKESLTKEEAGMLALFESELGAHLSENLLGNEAFIDRLVRKETSLAEKVLNKLADLKKMFERIGNAEARAEYNQIKKAEKLYLGAVEKAGYAYIGRKIVTAYKREELDKNKEIRYAFKGKRIASYINNKLDTPTLSYIRNELYKLYDGVESGIADSIGIVKDNTIYILDSGKENGKIDFGVRKQIKISDEKLRKERLEDINGNAIRKGHISRGLLGRFGGTPDNSSGSGVGRLLGNELSTNNAKSQNNKSGISTENATGGGERLSFSLKDSKGNTLTKEQAKFFADSKVRDDNGNLLVVYHGTEGTFFTFDKALRGSNTGSKDAKLGFFFTNSLNIAKDYAIEAQENKYFNLMHEVAMGDNKKLAELTHKDYFYRTMNVKEWPEPYKSYGEISEKVDKDEYDIIEVYLNIVNPLEVDWKGKTYKKAAMLRTVTQALVEGRDGVIIRNIDDSISSSGIISDVFVAFESNQIKATSNKKPTVSEDIRYSLKADINDYTEKQYNDFGWARVNGVLSYRENADFRAKYGNIKSGKQKDFRRSSRGEIIVEANDMEGGKHGVNNVLVFAKGSYGNYKITKVIRLKINNETELEKVRDYIYGQETDEYKKSYYQTDDIVGLLYEEEYITRHTAQDCPTYKQVKQSRTKGGRNDANSGIGAIGSGNLGENQRNVSYSLKADINDYTEKQYNDFGWARVNGVLSYRENGNFRAKYGKIKSGKQSEVHRTAGGEIIVETNDMERGKFGVNNVLVFAKGRYEDYKITKVIRLNLDNETSIEQIRDLYYEIETSRTKYPYTALDIIESVFGQEIVSEYAVGDFSSYQEIKAEWRRKNSRSKSGGADENYQREQDGSGNLGENQRNVSYSLKADVNDYTEKQYNDFGWARVNGVLSYRENGDFREKYGEIKSGKQSDVHKTASGEIIVAVSDMEKGQFGVNNVLVFAKGSYENYKITRVVKINLENETDIEIVRDYIYERESSRTSTSVIVENLYEQELIREYRNGDFGDYQELKGQRRESKRDSGINRDLQDGRRNLDQNRENELGKFSLKQPAEKDKYFYRLSDGQEKKALANYTKFKVYSKVDAESIVNNVLGNYMSFGETYGVVSGKTKKEVIEMLWRGLNTAEKGKQAKVALDIAEYILQNAVLENIYEDDFNQEYINTIQVLKPYLHCINLDSIKGDIKHRYDKDNSPYALWGKQKGKVGKGIDVIAIELEEQGFPIEATNPADIFFEIHDTYRACVAALKKQAKELLDSSLTDNERKELKQQIAKEVLRGFDEKGKPSKLAEIAKTYSDKAKFWKDKYYDERKRNTVNNRLLDSVQKIKDIKLGTFLNASQFNKNEIFKSSLLRLSNIKYRGDLNKSGTRKIVVGIQEWYTKNNPMLENCFDEEVSSMLEEIATGEGDLTTNELRALANVVDYFTHFIKNYNKVYRNEKYMEAQPIAQKYVDSMHANQNANVGWLRRFFEKYITTFGDPMTVARYMDRYSDGFYSEQLEALRMGVIGAGVMEMEMREPLEEFYKKHKKFLKTLKDKTVTYQGTEIPLSQAMLLYMSLNREQAILGLAKSGFAYADKNGKIIRPNGFAVEEGLEIDEIRLKAKDVQKELVSQFTETELEYISIAEKLFNEDCKEAKRKTDMNLRGYTNALDDYYVPIRRYVVGKSVDAETYLDEMASVSNASFNKDTVKGAKNELFLGTLEIVLDRHIRAVSLYANLALPLRDYDVLYNLDTAGNPNKPMSVKTEGVNVWAKGDEYFKKLVKDIKGIPASNSIIDKPLSWLRGGYAKYQLGANPKVWFTQLSSFGAAGSMLDVSSIIKGFGVKAKDVDEYCALAKLRNNENSAALAQGVMEKTGKVGDVLMKPIGMVDRLVIRKLFGACQVQVEKNGGAKIGTKENKVEAGKLLERVILETQQNALATERSWAMRDGNELLKTLTMFSADSMKVIGRVIDSIGEVAVLNAKRKNAPDSSEIAALDEKIKTATKKAGRSIASLVSTAVFMALIAQGFRMLYNKDEEDENIAQNMAVDTAGNLLGGLPLIRDIYSFYAEGYDLDNYAYSTVNDLLKSGQDALDLIGNTFNGTTDLKDVTASIKKAAYAGGQLLGIPTRNIYNFVYGLTKRFSAGTAYKIDNMFYDQNYSSELAKAIEKEDDEMIATIAGIMLDENIGGVENSSVRGELDNLTKKGFKVLPKSVGTSITYEGEKIDLTSGQEKSFKEVYSIANEALASLVGLSQYKSATDEVKAKAINFIWDIYYNLAIEEVLGVDVVSKAMLFAEAIDIEKLAIIIGEVREIEADTDNNGKSISGTRKAKIQKYVASLNLTAVQKYMIMGYLGYSNKNGQNQVKAYINRLNLSKTEKEKLLVYSGY